MKLWDTRCESSVFTLEHGSPVECVQLFPSGGVCISAGKFPTTSITISKSIYELLQQEIGSLSKTAENGDSNVGKTIRLMTQDKKHM